MSDAAKSPPVLPDHLATSMSVGLVVGLTRVMERFEEIGADLLPVQVTVAMLEKLLAAPTKAEEMVARGLVDLLDGMGRLGDYAPVQRLAAANPIAVNEARKHARVSARAAYLMVAAMIYRREHTGASEAEFEKSIGSATKTAVQWGLSRAELSVRGAWPWPAAPAGEGRGA